MVFPFLDLRDLQDDPLLLLTRRERALLEALSKGLTNRDLARDFGISANTVKFHLSNLFEKLGVKSRAQAIAFYYGSRPPRRARAERAGPRAPWPLDTAPAFPPACARNRSQLRRMTP